MTDSVKDKIQALISLYNQNRLQVVLANGEALIGQYPGIAILHNILGAANAGLGHNEQALLNFSKAVAIEPGNAEFHNNLGAVFESLGNPNAAIDSYNLAVKLDPNYAAAHNNMGKVLTQSGEFKQALTSIAIALKLNPDYADAHNNLGVANRALGQLEAAVVSYRKAVEIWPDFADAHNNLGNVLMEFGEVDQAISCYNKSLQLKPGYVQAYFNLGMAYKKMGKLDKVIECLGKALEIKPGFAAAHNGLGNAFKRVGKLLEARVSFNKAIQFNPEFAEAHCNLGGILSDSGELIKAIHCYTRALEIRPDYAWAQMQKLQQLAYICDWNALEIERSKLIDYHDSKFPVSPFGMLALEDKPENHRKRAERYVLKNFENEKVVKFTRPKKKSSRIRIGYFSADFKDHPVCRLMARVFELHDRTKFDIHAYSYSRCVELSMSQRFKRAFGEFHEVDDLAGKEIAQLAREEGIDIAIDLSGFTKGSRADIFAYRAAPIQINYLGYPGTMAATFIDYIIADKTIIPPDSQKYYSEKVIYLPDSYQAQDNTMQIAEKTPSRKELGLPECGFIFCCFNNSYKISKAEFDIWMRLLAKVDGSVLWLYKANELAKANLLREAQSRGIDPQRLIFSGGTFHADYLARLRLADLFLDTFNYNAGATASDALFAGLPLLTKIGVGYTARMASSLLQAIGLPELITPTEVAYERLALELAIDSQKLQSIRGKLAINRDNKPLFDTEDFTTNLEMAYQKVYNRYLSGAEPEHIYI